jgi:hypothetical protein
MFDFLQHLSLSPFSSPEALQVGKLIKTLAAISFDAWEFHTMQASSWALEPLPWSQTPNTTKPPNQFPFPLLSQDIFRPT